MGLAAAGESDEDDVGEVDINDWVDTLALTCQYAGV